MYRRTVVPASNPDDRDGESTFDMEWTCCTSNSALYDRCLRAMHLSPVPPTCSISCRVHIPLQPSNVPAPGEALLQARGKPRFLPADSLFEAYHSFGPQRVVVTGLKCIALSGVMKGNGDPGRPIRWREA